ncbi:DUF4158 domain-containing protein [Actinomadura terrae]|uniref:DUF4158 domain-containing protein n=1 Tax=Actinomadura terrae TaxID=604353 RepID=UPI001FA7BD6F|nr:DUF4158 domain-containing protein [Actinomadura terrae]
MTAIDRTAYPRLKKGILARELHDSFTPSLEEIAWVREQTRSHEAELVLAVLLKTHQRLAYFPKLEAVPAQVIAHVRGCLDLPEPVQAVSESERTLRDHKTLVRKRVKVTLDKKKAARVAAAIIRKEAQSKDNPADLINVAIEELVRHRLELLGFTTLDELVRTIRTEVNTAFFRMIRGRMSVLVQGHLLNLLVVDPYSRRSEFDGLKRPARRPSVSRVRKYLEWVRRLDNRFAGSADWLEGIPPAKVVHFAGEARVLDAAEMRDIKNLDKRLALLACLVHLTRVRSRDDMADMLCRRMAILHSKGRDKLEEIREKERAETERLWEVFGQVLTGARVATGLEEHDEQENHAESGDGRQGKDGESGERNAEGLRDTTEHSERAEPPTATGGAADHQDAHEANPADADGTGDAPGEVGGTDEEIRELHEKAGELMLAPLVDAGGIAVVSAQHAEISAHHGNNYMPLLAPLLHRPHRKALFDLLEFLELEATSSDATVLTAVEFIKANRKLTREWVDDRLPGTVTPLDVRFCSRNWAKTIRDKTHPGKFARRHLEVSVLSYLAAELKSGDIAVKGADSFGNFLAQLMTPAEIAPLIDKYCEQAGLPTTGAEFRQSRYAELRRVSADVDAGYPTMPTWSSTMRRGGRRSSAARARNAPPRRSGWSSWWRTTAARCRCWTSSPRWRTGCRGGGRSVRCQDQIPSCATRGPATAW